jgi:hypothetical protein
VIKQGLVEDSFADGSRRWQMPFEDSPRIALHADAALRMSSDPIISTVKYRRFQGRVFGSR